MHAANVQLPDELIYRKIVVIRNQKVMLDSDLAELYQVDTKRLNEQIRRNPERFPPDFMFQLTQREWNSLKLQWGDAGVRDHGGRRKLPYAFTEHGVLMLSSVLNSNRAIAVNIQIMWVYIQIKEMLQTNQDLIARMAEMEERMEGQDEHILRVFQYVQQLVEDEESVPRKKVGYRP